MPVDSSNILNLSRVQSTEIDSSRNLKSNAAMPADRRDQVAFRLRLLPIALDRPTKAVYEATGLSKSGWSNVTSPNQSDRITVDAALDLWEAFGVSVEWVFKGDYNTVLDADLRASLKKAEQDARRKAA